MQTILSPGDAGPEPPVLIDCVYQGEGLAPLPTAPETRLLLPPPPNFPPGLGGRVGGLGNEQKELVRKGEAGGQLNRASQLTWVSPLRPVETGSTRPPGWPQATQQAGP